MLMYYKIYQYQLNEKKTIAIVGPSGCGKSIVVALIERFY